MRLARMLASLALIAGAVLMAVAQDAAMYRGGPGHTGAGSAIAFPVALRWEWTGDASAKTASSPAVVEGVVYLGLGGQLYAIDEVSGSVKWTYPSGRRLPITFRFTPAIAEGTLFIAGSDGSVYAVSCSSGKLVWQFACHSGITTPLTVASGVVYVGTGDGKVYALDATSGEQKWGGPYKAFQAIIGPVCVSQDFAMVLADDGSLVGLASATGAPRWRQRIPGVGPDNHLALSGDFLYVNSQDALYAITPTTGRVRWSKRIVSQPVLSPVADTGRVFTTTSTGEVWGFDLTGRQLWAKPVKLDYPLQAPPTLAGDTLLCAIRRGGVLAVDAKTGTTKWSYILKPPVRATVSSSTEGGPAPAYYALAASDVVAADNTAFVLTENGQLLAFSSKMAVDMEPPSVLYVDPEPGSELCGQPPMTLRARIEDMGSGIVADSVVMVLDGNALGDAKNPVVYDEQKGTVEYKLQETGAVKPLTDGRHVIELKARDWMGNALDKKWTIWVDRSLSPVIPKNRRLQDPGTSGTGPGAGTSGGMPGVPGGGIKGGGGKGGGGGPGGGLGGR